MLASDVVLERNPSFVANYVARSQQLEECIIELLLHRHSEPVSVKKVSSLISDSASSGFDGSCFDEELVGLNLPVRGTCMHMYSRVCCSQCGIMCTSCILIWMGLYQGWGQVHVHTFVNRTKSGQD